MPGNPECLSKQSRPKKGANEIPWASWNENALGKGRVIFRQEKLKKSNLLGLLVWIHRTYPVPKYSRTSLHSTANRWLNRLLYNYVFSLRISAASLPYPVQFSGIRRSALPHPPLTWRMAPLSAISTMPKCEGPILSNGLPPFHRIPRNGPVNRSWRVYRFQRIVKDTSF